MALRIGGLASGMDTESIVKELMKVQSMKLDKFKQQKTKTEWKRDSYREFNTQLLDFRSKITNMKLSTTFRSRTTASSDDTRVTATATSAAGLGSFTMNSVSQLATAAYRTGASVKSSTASSVSTNTALYNNSTIAGTTGFTWEEGSVERETINPTSTSNELNSNINSSNLANYTNLSEVLSVKVGSVSYKVINNVDPDTNKPVGENTVTLKDGKLIFSNDIQTGSNVTVNYVAKNKVDELTVNKDATSFNLSKKSISTKDNITFSIEVTKPTEDNPNPTPEKSEYITDMSKIVDGKVAIFDRADTSSNPVAVGTLDLITGKVQLTSALEGNASIKTSAYTQNYTSTSLSVTKNEVDYSESFFFTGDQTLDQITSTVNASNLGVSMFFDSHSNKMTMNRKETGESGIKFNDNSNDLFTGLLGFETESELETRVRAEVTASLNVSSGAEFDKAYELEMQKYNGQNAKFNLNGLETERSTNNFTINGVNFTLKKTFDATTDGAVTVGVNNDVDSVVKNIKDFVDSYNKLVESINLKVTEKVNRAYAPPTDEEKEALSEKQLEDWIAQAKSGLLRNDSILNSTLSGMRMDFYGSVSNSGVDTIYNQLTQIGISTTANYLDGGKLEVNETKLRAALEADPEGVEALFTANGSTDSSQGILNRLTDTVNSAMDRLKDRAGNSFSTNQTYALGREIDSLDDQIDRWKDRLQTMEDRYWKQFSAMEKAIQNANAQSASIANFFTQQ